MKKILFSLFALLTLSASAQSGNFCKVVSRKTVKCDGYFPQLSLDGTQLLYAPNDAATLYIYDLNKSSRSVVSTKGMPGFEARFSPDGKVYYIQAHPDEKTRLVYRSCWEYDPSSGQERMVLSGTHGAVHAVKGTEGVAAVCERESKNWNVKQAGTFVWTWGSYLYIVVNGRTRRFSPVPCQTCYLYSDVSPDGTKVLFTIPGDATYVVDLNGKVLSKLPRTIMPSWFNNDYIVAQGNVKPYRYEIIMMRADGTGGIQTLASGTCMTPSVSDHNVVYTNKGGAITIMKIRMNDEPEEQAAPVEEPAPEENATPNADEETKAAE